MPYRADVEAHAARLASLRLELEQKQREIDEAANLLGEAKAIARREGIYDYDASPPSWAYVVTLGVLAWSLVYVWIQ